MINRPVLWASPPPGSAGRNELWSGFLSSFYGPDPAQKPSGFRWLICGAMSGFVLYGAVVSVIGNI